MLPGGEAQVFREEGEEERQEGQGEEERQETEDSTVRRPGEADVGLCGHGGPFPTGCTLYQCIGYT